MFAIIIPFYQVTPGILLRALNSIFAQSYTDWRVIIVDDESPVRAQDEIQLLPDAVRARVQIERIKNGGPGKARNAGLEFACAMAEVDAIAFLDSDDRWDPQHLERAALALRHGDVYFCDYDWPGGGVMTMFRHNGFYDHSFSASLGDGLIRKFDGNFLELILQRWPVCISALCIKKSVFTDIRFDERFFYSSEDQHYFLQLARLANTVFYDCHTGLHLDKGMQFYSDRKRGQLKYTRSCISNLLFHIVVQKEFQLSTDARRVNRRHMLKNLLEIIISETKSMLKNGALHTELCPELFRVLRYRIRAR